MENIVPSILFLLLGIAAGIGLTVFFAYIKGNSIANKANKMIEEAKKEVGMVIESLDNIDVAYELSRIHNVDMPIVDAVYDVIYNHLNPHQAVTNLMTRDKKSE